MFNGKILIREKTLKKITGVSKAGAKWILLNFGDNSFLSFKNFPTNEELFYAPNEWIPFNRLPEEQVEKIRKVGIEI